MARLSRDKKQDHGLGVRPLDVRVPAAGDGTVDGVPVAAAPGQELRQAVLNRLQNLARAVGAPVLATVHDEQLGYVLPLRVTPDGSSDLTGTPTPIPAPAPAPTTPASPRAGTPPRRHPAPPPQARPPAPPAPVRKAPAAPLPDLAPEPKPTPTPARGFDAVAEAVLGDGPITAPGDGTAPALLAEETARINEAVRDSRTEDAARLAEETVARASRTLGPDHPEVLRLRELTAYIAYLFGRSGPRPVPLPGAGPRPPPGRRRRGRVRQRAERGDRLACRTRPRAGPGTGSGPDRPVVPAGG
ncbi:Tetratricopeptide repeat protein OS=Streptomyces fumanus OX=67302 GN=GCM10018772_61340 PE=4 SV=1 [Streptomyces fumanus]